LTPILKEVVKWVADPNQTPSASNRTIRLVYNCLKDFKPFKEAVTTAVKFSLEKTMKLLQIYKDEVVKFCKKNECLMTEITKLVVKAAPRGVMITCGVKQAIRYGVTEAGQQVVQQTLKVANPVGIVADVAQAGMEFAGYEDAGKTVGMLGNIGTGAVTGAIIGGPVGFTVGALAGFLTWGAGEVTAAAIHRALSEL